MKIYLLVDKAKSGKTTLLKQLGYKFCGDDSSRFSMFLKLIYNGEKKIAIDDFMNIGATSSLLKLMFEKRPVLYEEKFKNPILIQPKMYEDVEIVLSTKFEHLHKFGLGLLARCQKVSVEEFKKIKGVI